MPRMKILNAVEQDTFASPPVFTTAQCRHHFDFPHEFAYMKPSGTNCGSSWGYVPN